MPDLPGDTVHPRPHGFRKLAIVRAFSGLNDPAVSDGVVFGKQADGVLRHLDTLLRRGVEEPVGDVRGKRRSRVETESRVVADAFDDDLGFRQ